MFRKRLFQSVLAFVLLFFVLPTHLLIWASTAPHLTVGVNYKYLLLLCVCFLLVHFLVVLLFKLAAIFRHEGKLAWADELCWPGDLRGLDSFLLRVLPLISIGLALAALRWRTEDALFLSALVWFGLLLNPKEKPPKKPIPLPVRVPDGDIHKRYRWKFSESSPHSAERVPVEFTLELDISSARYKACKEEPRELNPLRWDKYVVAPLPEVEVLAAKMAELHRERGYCTYDQAANVLAFAQQCIVYTKDLLPEGEEIEYPKYPIESLVEEAGDCEDHAILAAAVLKRMGFDVALLFCPGHAALGVAGADGLPGTYIEDRRTGIKYFYAETTAEGWEIGELPQELREEEFIILPIVLAIER
jgi:predicted transglutaminase-like cysteine proteinase